MEESMPVDNAALCMFACNSYSSAHFSLVGRFVGIPILSILYKLQIQRLASCSPTSSCAPTFNPVGRSLSAQVSRNFRCSIPHALLSMRVHSALHPLLNGLLRIDWGRNKGKGDNFLQGAREPLSPLRRLTFSLE